MICAKYRVDRFRHLVLGWMLAGVTLAAGALAAQVSAAELKPQAQDRQISKTVARLLVDEHLSKQPLSEEMSRRRVHDLLEDARPDESVFHAGRRRRIHKISKRPG